MVYIILGKKNDPFIKSFLALLIKKINELSPKDLIKQLLKLLKLLKLIK